MNQAIHSVDLLTWFMGAVPRFVCTATLVHRHIEVEDVAVASIALPSALGTIEATTAAFQAF